MYFIGEKITQGFSSLSFYDLTKSGILEFLQRDDIIITDEGDETVDLKDFIVTSMMTDLDGLDMFNNTERNLWHVDDTRRLNFENLGYTIKNDEFYSPDDLRFSLSTNFS